jgi:hypothetical protein
MDTKVKRERFGGLRHRTIHFSSFFAGVFSCAVYNMVILVFGITVMSASLPTVWTLLVIMEGIPLVLACLWLVLSPPDKL